MIEAYRLFDQFDPHFLISLAAARNRALFVFLIFGSTRLGLSTLISEGSFFV